jgi:hypothetical protein
MAPTPKKHAGRYNLPKDQEEPLAHWQKLYDLDQIEALLRASAKEGRPITYSETLDALGYRFSRPKMRALCVALGEIDRRAEAREEPELAVLVVRASDKIPGQGWWVQRNDPNYNGPWDGPRAEEYVQAIQQKTYDYWKSR